MTDAELVEWVCFGDTHNRATQLIGMIRKEEQGRFRAVAVADRQALAHWLNVNWTDGAGVEAGGKIMVDLAAILDDIRNGAHEDD